MDIDGQKSLLGRDSVSVATVGTGNDFVSLESLVARSFEGVHQGASWIEDLHFFCCAFYLGSSICVAFDADFDWVFVLAVVGLLLDEVREASLHFLKHTQLLF